MRSISKSFAIVLFVALLTGCFSNPELPIESPSEVEITDDKASPTAEAELGNEWVEACENFNSESGEDYKKAYSQIIGQVCEIAHPESYEVQYVTSPNVSAEDSQRYLDSEKFHESYWSTYMDKNFPPKIRIIFSEKDQAWWEDQQKQNLLNPDLGWFTSTTEGWHCRVESKIFCSMFYEPKSTTTGYPTEFRIIGTDLVWENWQIVNGAHEATHFYQDSHGQSHWAFWYVEGQATFFELAMAKLLFGHDKIRSMYLFENRIREDTKNFNPTSPEYVAKYFKECDQSKDGGCQQFKYGVGSMFHEKLVADFGLETYFEWQRYLNENMPKGNPGEFSREKKGLVVKVFGESFSRVFGISQEEFEMEVMTDYIYDYFKSTP